MRQNIRSGSSYTYSNPVPDPGEKLKQLSNADRRVNDSLAELRERVHRANNQERKPTH